MAFKLVEMSPNVITKQDIKQKINIFSQFYLPDNKERLCEIQEALKKNTINPYINKIYLLNERIYSEFELGINSEIIHQINIGKRVKFSDFFNFMQYNNIQGFNIIINIDIFFDKTIYNLNYSDIDITKKIFSLLRFEYRNENNLDTCLLYGSKEYFKKYFKNEKTPVIEGSPASSDTWIIHSNNKLTKKEISLFNFELGLQGCDNKIIYLFKILGYDIYNDPYFVKTFHIQKESSVKRIYNNKKIILPPWGIYIPSCVKLENVNLKILDVDLKEYIKETKLLSFHNFTNDNIYLKNYITEKLNNNSKFIIPRIAGIENVLSYIGIGLINNKIKWDYLKYKNILDIMKKNAGIKLTNNKSIIKYCNCYFNAFDKCDLYASWESYGDVKKAIRQSHDYLTYTFPKQQIWGYVYDIFHYINNPWTTSLANQRILIISPFVESIQEKIHIRDKIYGKDLFPGCSFILIKPPQTHGTENCEEFDVEFNKFCNQLKLIEDKFDIALCSCGGYGNPVCAFIYNNLNKSAIYVGGVLQMYFGIYGERWLRERKDVMRLYLNEHWSRPNENEKPASSKEIENNCYW